MRIGSPAQAGLASGAGHKTIESHCSKSNHYLLHEYGIREYTIPRVEQGSGIKGSRNWVQKLVAERPDLLTSLIGTLFEGLPNRDIKPA